jgi:hypothetical protein
LLPGCHGLEAALKKPVSFAWFHFYVNSHKCNNCLRLIPADYLPDGVRTLATMRNAFGMPRSDRPGKWRGPCGVPLSSRMVLRVHSSLGVTPSEWRHPEHKLICMCCKPLVRQGLTRSPWCKELKHRSRSQFAALSGVISCACLHPWE